MTRLNRAQWAAIDYLGGSVKATHTRGYLEIEDAPHSVKITADSFIELIRHGFVETLGGDEYGLTEMGRRLDRIRDQAPLIMDQDEAIRILIAAGITQLKSKAISEVEEKRLNDAMRFLWGKVYNFEPPHHF